LNAVGCNGHTPVREKCERQFTVKVSRVNRMVATVRVSVSVKIREGDVLPVREGGYV